MDWRKLLLLFSGLILGGAIGILVLWRGIPSSSQTKRVPPKVGVETGDFELKTLDGETVQLSDFRGKAVVINFWATWCPPCKEEMPLLQRYADQHPDQMVVIGVDYQEGEKDVQSFVQSLNLTFPILLDENGKVANQYFVRSFPSTYFIDSQGILRAQHIGQLDQALLDEYLVKVGVDQ